MKSRRHPQPENTRRRQELRGARNALIGALIISAVLAIVALVRMAVAPAMMIAVAASQLVGAAWLARRRPRARLVALVAALLPLAWGLEQIMVLDVVTWFQLALLGVGALEALLVAASTPPDAPKARKSRERYVRPY